FLNAFRSRSFLNRILPKELAPLWLGLFAIFAYSLQLGFSTAVAQPRLKPAQPSAWPGYLRGAPQTLRLAGKYAYVGLSRPGPTPGGVTVVDLSDPANPVPIGSCALGGIANGIDLAGGYA